ncbi:hypothetical protein LguiB_007912 [Lonicera macranthoides]
MDHRVNLSLLHEAFARFKYEDKMVREGIKKIRIFRRKLNFLEIQSDKAKRDLAKHCANLRRQKAILTAVTKDWEKACEEAKRVPCESEHPCQVVRDNIIKIGLGMQEIKSRKEWGSKMQRGTLIRPVNADTPELGFPRAINCDNLKLEFQPTHPNSEHTEELAFLLSKLIWYQGTYEARNEFVQGLQDEIDCYEDEMKCLRETLQKVDYNLLDDGLKKMRARLIVMEIECEKSKKDIENNFVHLGNREADLSVVTDEWNKAREEAKRVQCRTRLFCQVGREAIIQIGSHSGLGSRRDLVTVKAGMRKFGFTNYENRKLGFHPTDPNSKHTEELAFLLAKLNWHQAAYEETKHCVQGMNDQIHHYYDDMEYLREKLEIAEFKVREYEEDLNESLVDLMEVIDGLNKETQNKRDLVLLVPGNECNRVLIDAILGNGFNVKHRFIEDLEENSDSESETELERHGG